MPRVSMRSFRAVACATLHVSAAAAFGQPCSPNTNPSCSGAENLGVISGDKGAATVNRSANVEKFYRIRLREDDQNTFALRPVLGRIRLQVPPNVKYDLIVRCGSCASTTAKSSAARPGTVEEVVVMRSDVAGGDDSFDVYVEVRYVGGSSCASWSLTVNGNVGTTATALKCG